MAPCNIGMEIDAEIGLSRDARLFIGKGPPSFGGATHPGVMLGSPLETRYDVETEIK